MRVTSKGQVTIPRDLLELAGISANSEVIFGVEDGKISIVPMDGGRRIAYRDRLARFMAELDRLEGTGDQSLRAEDVMAITRDR